MGQSKFYNSLIKYKLVNMKKLLIIFLPVFLIFVYIFSAMHSFHQVHKSIYYNDKQLSKNYIEWDEVRNNFKDFSNAYFIDEISKDKEYKELGGLGILVTGLVSKFADFLVDTYINSEGLSLLIEKSDKRSEIPEPNFTTLIGGISIMKFDSLNSFYVNLETDKEKFPIHFKRIGTKWKVIEIEFPKEFFDEMK